MSKGKKKKRTYDLEIDHRSAVKALHAIGDAAERDLKPKVNGWSLTWQAKTYSDADLTGQHLAALALISGDDRFEQLAVTPDEIKVYPAQGYMRLMNLLGAFVTVDTANEYDGDEAEVAAALDEIRQASAEDILSAVMFR
jgi:hypothetical protein